MHHWTLVLDFQTLTRSRPWRKNPNTFWHCGHELIPCQASITSSPFRLPVEAKRLIPVSRTIRCTLTTIVPGLEVNCAIIQANVAAHGSLSSSLFLALGPSGRLQIPILLSHRPCSIGKDSVAEAYCGVHIVRHHQPHAEERRHGDQCPQEKRQAVAIKSVNMSKLNKKLEANLCRRSPFCADDVSECEAKWKSPSSPPLPASWHRQLRCRQSVLTRLWRPPGSLGNWSWSSLQQSQHFADR